jgi:hypothetical protein
MKSEDSLLGQLTRFISNSHGSLRKTVGRQLLSLSLLALTAFTSTPIWAPESSIGAEGPDTVSPFTDNGLEGVWDVTVTIRDAAGNPLRSFRAMNMYMAGGQFEEFGVGTPVGQRGPGMGVWQGEGGRRYDALLEFFRFNVDGTFAGTQKVTRTVELSEGEDKFTSSASIQILDINGQLIQSGYATETAARFNWKPGV